MEPEHPKTVQGQTSDGRVLAADPAVFADAQLSAMALGFHVGSLGFLLPLSLHCEVIGQLPVSPLPKVEPWFSGLLNMRGTIVPVVDLRLLLNETAPPPKKRYLFSIDRGEKTMALWIDGYPQMLPNIGVAMPAPPPLPDLLKPCITQAYWQDGQIWLQASFAPLFKTLGNPEARP
ncbi:MAG: chemotaxis protein CheW [Methylovulum sp.]|nr:chemotaxis protein CheW [Methylovulum sp.]